MGGRCHYRVVVVGGGMAGGLVVSGLHVGATVLLTSSPSSSPSPHRAECCRAAGGSRGRRRCLGTGSWPKVHQPLQTFCPFLALPSMTAGGAGGRAPVRWRGAGWRLGPTGSTGEGGSAFIGLVLVYQHIMKSLCPQLLQLCVHPGEPAQ